MVKFIIHLFAVLILFLSTFLIIFAYQVFTTEKPSKITVDFVRNRWIDYACPAREALTPQVIKEADSLIPRFAKIWVSDGNAFLEQAYKIIGRPFHTRHQTVYVFACPSFSSLGFPAVMVPLYPFLSTPGKALHPFHFLDTVFHEIMHLYVAKALVIRGGSDLLQRYKNEAPLVLLNLHVYALQKEVYMTLGKPIYWQEVVRRAKTLRPEYARAVAIVEEASAEAFVKEIKNPKLEQKKEFF